MAAERSRARGDRVYEKPALDLNQLLDRLADRGVAVPDRERALRYLRHIGYYRFSPYLIPFRSTSGREGVLRAGTQFDDILDLYVFDRRLRLLVLDALERVEVAIRSALTDHMSVTYDDPFWYCSAHHFRDIHRHNGFLTMVSRMCDRQLSASPETSTGELNHTSALEHYLTNYGQPELPPSWVMLETLSIGQLDGLVANLRRRADRTAVASAVGLNEPLLASWLKSYVRVRNICAHHGRLWNVGLGVYPQLPKSTTVRWLHDPTAISASPARAQRLYPVLVSLQSILSAISPNTTWASKLSALLERHPRVPIAGMGVPADWRSDGFWSAALDQPRSPETRQP